MKIIKDQSKRYFLKTITKLLLLIRTVFLTGFILHFYPAYPVEKESYVQQVSSSPGAIRSLFPSKRFTPLKMFRIEVEAGDRMVDLMKKLVQKGITTETAFRKAALMINPTPFPLPWMNKSGLQEDISRLEGLITPGVYLFYPHETSISDKQKDSFSRAFNNAFYILDELIKESLIRFEQISNNRWLNPYQEIILASIVQKEAGLSREYGLIASVFYNRMKKGMPLASCPSVEYALGYHRPFLTFSDISIDSPYNLYTRKGLPPTPICFFTDDALNAVQNPPSSSYYYFVYDWSCDKLLFSRTYEEHLENVKIARSNYSKKYGKDSLYRVYHGLFYENP